MAEPEDFKQEKKLYQHIIQQLDGAINKLNILASTNSLADTGYVNQYNLPTRSDILEFISKVGSPSSIDSPVNFNSFLNLTSNENYSSSLITFTPSDQTDFAPPLVQDYYKNPFSFKKVEFDVTYTDPYNPGITSKNIFTERTGVPETDLDYPVDNYIEECIAIKLSCQDSLYGWATRTDWGLCIIHIERVSWEKVGCESSFLEPTPCSNSELISDLKKKGPERKTVNYDGTTNTFDPVVTFSVDGKRKQKLIGVSKKFKKVLEDIGEPVENDSYGSLISTTIELCASKSSRGMIGSCELSRDSMSRGGPKVVTKTPTRTSGFTSIENQIKKLQERGTVAPGTRNGSDLDALIYDMYSQMMKDAPSLGVKLCCDLGTGGNTGVGQAFADGTTSSLLPESDKSADALISFLRTIAKYSKPSGFLQDALTFLDGSLGLDGYLKGILDVPFLGDSIKGAVNSAVWVAVPGSGAVGNVGGYAGDGASLLNSAQKGQTSDVLMKIASIIGR